MLKQQVIVRRQQQPLDRVDCVPADHGGWDLLEQARREAIVQAADPAGLDHARPRLEEQAGGAQHALPAEVGPMCLHVGLDAVERHRHEDRRRPRARARHQVPRLGRDGA